LLASETTTIWLYRAIAIIAGVIIGLLSVGFTL